MTFVEHLSRYAPAEWVSALETLAPGIHPIDRNAARVWLAFYPQGPAPAAVSASHDFLFGHHHWPQVKRAVMAAVKDTAWPDALTDVITRVADHATRTTQVDRDQLLGIGTAALLTLRAVGQDVFTAASASVQVPHWSHVRSVRQVRRARRNRTGWLHSLVGGRRLRVRYSELRKTDWGMVEPGDHLGSALPDALRRCGVVCAGACVVGVIAGADRLSPMVPEELSLLQRDGNRVPMSDDGAPLVRLACHARPVGDVTIVPRPAI